MKSAWKKKITFHPAIRKGIKGLSYSILPIGLSLGVTLAIPSDYRIFGALIGSCVGEVARLQGRKTEKFINRLPNWLSPHYKVISFLEGIRHDFVKPEEDWELSEDYRNAHDPGVWKKILEREIKYYEELLCSLKGLGERVKKEHLAAVNSICPITEACEFIDQFTRTFIKTRVDFIDSKTPEIRDSSLKEDLGKIRERLNAFQEHCNEIINILNSALK